MSQIKITIKTFGKIPERNIAMIESSINCIVYPFKVGIYSVDNTIVITYDSSKENGLFAYSEMNILTHISQEMQCDSFEITHLIEEIKFEYIQ